MQRVEPAALDQLLHPTIDPKAPRDVIATGLPASPGAPRGKSCFRRRRSRRGGEAGREGHSGAGRNQPEDIHGMHAAEGILTARGGMTTHAAVVARGMGKPCVVGREFDLAIDYANEDDDARWARRSKRATGSRSMGPPAQVLLGEAPTIEPELSGEFAHSMGWADKMRRLKVRANADTPNDAAKAREVRRRGHRPVPHRAHVL